MPANWRAGAVLVDQRHDEQAGIDARPLANPGANRQQERWKRRARVPSVRFPEKRYAPTSDDAAHLEIRKGDAGNRTQQTFLFICADEGLPIVEAWRQVILEETPRRGHTFSLHRYQNSRVAADPQPVRPERTDHGKARAILGRWPLSAASR